MSEGLLSQDYLGRSLLFGNGGGAPWIGDWSAYTTVYNWAGSTTSVPAISWSTFLNITGEGWLTFAQGFSSFYGYIPDMRITVDGSVYTFSGNTPASVSNGNVVSKPIYFKTSLKIEAYNSESTGASNLGCDYTYLLKSGTPNVTKQSILFAGSRRTSYNETTSTGAVDIANITGAGYLLGAEFSGLYIGAGAGIVLANVIINGVNKMSARNVFSPVDSSNKFHHFDGPIRFTSSLRVQHYISAAGARAISKVFYTLD